MGVILSGILSAVSGKVAGVVGAKWKDKAYLRAYVKPANPNTAAQQTQRALFKAAADFGKALVGQIFNAYTDKFQKSMSGFNYFIKTEITDFVAPIAYEAIRICYGPLSRPAVTAAQYIGLNVEISFNPNPGNNGLDTDAIFACVYDESTGIFYFAAAEGARVDGQIDVPVPAGLVAGNLHSWLLAAQYVGTTLEMISNSYGLDVTV